MKIKTATIYPYSKDDVQLIRYAHLLTEIMPVKAVSPPGWGLCGSDATKIDGGKAQGIQITDDLEKALKKTDVLIVTSFANYFGKTGNLGDTCKLAIQMKKPVILLYPPETKEDENYIKQVKQQNLLYWMAEKNDNYIIEISKYHYCSELDSPVVFITGEGPLTGKFETQLGIRHEFLKRGYKVSQIGSRPFCELFGFHSLPGFLFHGGLDEIQKIISLNYYVKGIEKNENPDVFIVGIPGGIMPIVQQIHNNYGILHVEIGAALEPDIIVHNLYSSEHTTSYLEKTAHLIEGRLGTRTDCFILSNTIIDYSTINETGEFRTVTFPKMYDKPIPNRIPVLPILLPNTFSLATDILLSTLEDYGAVQYY